MSCVITGASATTMVIWFILATIFVTNTHSGYWWAYATKHDDHHRYFNVNYGIFITDKIFGTSK